MNWKHFEEFENEQLSEIYDTKVLCLVDVGDVLGNIIEQYLVLNYRPKTKQFLNWGYNEFGKFVSFIYPNPYSQILKYVIINELETN